MRLTIPWRIDELLQRLLRYSAQGHGFLLTCGALAMVGTLTAAYPVTAVVVPAVLLASGRWRLVALFASLGSALGASLLVVAMHHIGWASLYAHYPQLTTHPDWLRVMSWVDRYGTAALFVVAALPFPQTPALVFFGISRPDYAGVFVATLAGKMVKYGIFAWASKRFPERFGDSLAALARRLGIPVRQNGNGNGKPPE